MGSWSFAYNAMKIQGKHYLVEKDIEVAKCCARTHSIPIVTIKEAFDMLITCGKVPINGCVFHGEVEDHRLWTILSVLGVEVLTLSPPCQPWSTVGRRMGLAAKDGRSWAVVISNSADLGIDALICESVPGFKSHEHAKHLTQFAKQCGLNLMIGNVIPVEHALPITRSRWICVFIRSELAEKIDTTQQINAQNVRLPIYPDMGGLCGRDAFIQQFQQHE